MAELLCKTALVLAVCTNRKTQHKKRHVYIKSGIPPEQLALYHHFRSTTSVGWGVELSLLASVLSAAFAIFLHLSPSY